MSTAYFPNSLCLSHLSTVRKAPISLRTSLNFNFSISASHRHFHEQSTPSPVPPLPRICIR